MADGFVGAQIGGSIQWFGGFADANLFGVHGEPIGQTDGAQMAWLDASRCPSCRLILARY